MVPSHVTPIRILIRMMVEEVVTREVVVAVVAIMVELLGNEIYGIFHDRRLRWSDWIICCSNDWMNTKSNSAAVLNWQWID
jgi:hypothetical protein